MIRRCTGARHRLNISSAATIWGETCSVASSTVGIALIAGIGATVISVTIGVIVGALAGFLAGWTDTILSRIIDTLMAFPIIALLIVLAAVLEPSTHHRGRDRHHPSGQRYTRVVRADILSLHEQDYLQAPRASSVRDWRIIWRHLDLRMSWDR